jgi:octanoyl-[GcvH]:protein N-octanoyltransferase
MADIDAGPGRPAQAGPDRTAQARMQRRICVIDEVIYDIRAERTPATGGWAAGGRDPLLDSALGPALLQAVAGAGRPDEGGSASQYSGTAVKQPADVGAGLLGTVPETLRVYRPQPTLAFSGRDCAAPGIGAAADAAAAANFAPVRRGPGGRAAAYHAGALCLDHVGVDSSGASGAFDPQQIRPRFIEFGDLLTAALRAVGVDAQLGPVPGEYCPGEFSINDGRGHKLVGTAQRLVRGGWLFGTVILVTDPEPVREVLIPVYQALELDWDPQTVGAVQSSAPGVTVDDVRTAVLDEFSRFGVLQPGALGEDLLALAAGRVDRHRVPGRR